MNPNDGGQELDSLRAIYMRAHDLVELLRPSEPDTYPEALTTEQGVAWAKLENAIKAHNR